MYPAGRWGKPHPGTSADPLLKKGEGKKRSSEGTVAKVLTLCVLIIFTLSFLKERVGTCAGVRFLRVRLLLV